MFLNINKPLGLTSFDVVSRVRRMTGEKRVGHAGTLDPMATGVLLVAVGREFTKRISELMDLDKEYVAEIVLGAETDSLDRDGRLMDTIPVPPLTRAQIDSAVHRFVGQIEQIPPVFSAIHHQGKRLYELARANVDVKPAPRIVEIDAIEVVDYPDSEKQALFPHLKIKVTCQKGVYIRSLARDIGHALGTTAFLSALVRTRIGEWRVEDAMPIA
jgi:tRNA pseudouridine55 synthase